MTESKALNNIDWVGLGARLQHARKAAGLNQDRVASELGVSRPTVVAIEQGKRRLVTTELVTLARLFGQEMSVLLRERVTKTDLSVAFRARFEKRLFDLVGETALDQAVAQLQRLCEQYLELEVMLGANMARRYPAPYAFDGYGDVTIAADEIAGQERDRLNLGDAPIGDLRALLETEVGLRIFYFDLPSQIAGMFGYTDELGGCIAINAKHPAERQRMTLAHEYAHFLTNRYNPEIQVLRYERRPDSERFADAFAARFLLPSGGVRRQLRAHVQAGGSFTVGDLLHFAKYFNVSFEAYCYRLEEMGILAAGTSDSYKAEGLQVRKAKELAGVKSDSDSRTHKLPERYQLLAVRAYLTDELTEGQLMRYLEASRMDTREMIRRLQEQTTLDEEGFADITELSLEEPIAVRSR